MSRIALVLGAGATLANAQHFHRERLMDLNPPLDFTFFARVSALGIQVESELREYASSHPYLNPFENPEQPVRAEEFFRDLFADFQEASPNDPTVRSYEQLLSIYLRVLRETTNWMSSDSKRGGPVGRLIAAAARGWENVSILTFNHDLVIENEIRKRARLSPRWCLDEGYGSFSNVATIAGPTVETLRRHGSLCEHHRPIELLKLHGSLNWYVRMNGRHPSPRILSGTGTLPPIHISPRRTIRTQLRSTRAGRTGRGRTHWYTWPVVIPPVYGKEALIRQFVPSVWDDAALALAGAERVVFFGYSLPDLDIRAQRLLQKGISRNAELPWIDVVNPDPGSPSRYATVLRPSALRWYPSVAAFLGRDGHIPA